MLKPNKNLVIISLLAVLMFSIAAPGVLAQTASSSTASLQAQQNELEQQLQQIEQQISADQQQLNVVTAQQNTLANKIKQLQIQQSSLELQIQQTNLELQSTQNQISQTQSQIDENNSQLADLQNEMTSILQQIYEQDSQPIIGVLLSQNGMTDFYDTLSDYEQVSQSLAQVSENIKIKTVSLQSQEQQLNDQETQQQNLINMVGLQNDQLSQTIGDQNNLLAETKGQESNYQAILKNQQSQASAIEKQIYQLFDVGTQIDLGQAIQIADYASSQTGVRQAFLLAILTQESNLGKNVGTCNRPGDPPSKSYKVIMNPTRDIPPFLQITAQLGLDPDTTPVSCPAHDSKGNQVGWGGAMGPAQFIPSTWVGYESQIQTMTGSPANPWDIRDAFLASALKLKADGAGTQAGEYDAALRYYSGTTNSKYDFYADSVQQLANQYQSDIDTINNQ